jgi:hypothetical protein
VDLLLDHQYVASGSIAAKEMLTLARSCHYYHRRRDRRRYHLWPRQMQVNSVRCEIPSMYPVVESLRCHRL